MRFNYLRRRNRRLIYLIVFFILCNLCVIYSCDLEHSRLFRLVTGAVFFVYYFSKKEFNDKRLTLVLLFLLLRDVFFQFYEVDWGCKGYMFLGVLIFIAMILERQPALRGEKISGITFLISAALILANIYGLITLMSAISHAFNDGIEVALFYLYGALMIVVGAVAITYNNKYNSTRSLYYVMLVSGFIISDIAALFAYYFGFETFYYIDRLCFVISLGLLVNHALNYDRAREEIFQFEMIDNNL